LRILKLAVISFIFLFLAITCISLFIPSHIRISKAIDINATKESVMDQIKDVSKWKNWYPGTDSLKIYYINGEAKGIMRDTLKDLIIITATNDSTILATKAGSGFKEMVIGWNIIPGRDTNTSTLQWYMDFHLRWYPWEKFRSLLFEKLYGSQMEKGLTNLKTLLGK
jgi:Polyketide cyclase / dehydrase and lipid transport